MGGLFRIAAAAVAALAFPASALAGTLTLHPAGFGTHSYAAWKAQEGEPDSHGSADEALYFQKETSTATFAAGVAVIEGIAGTPAAALTGLAWDHREDGHCGAGAPRWNLSLQDANGNHYTVFLGCYAAAHQEKLPASGHGWCRDRQTQEAIGNEVFAQTGQQVDDLTITGLAIVFDEGTDTANPPPVGCAQEQLAGGFVYLDDVTVDLAGEPPHCWTAARDNSVNGVNNCELVGGESDLPTLSPLVGIPVDPLDTELVTALNYAYRGVATSDWLLYPYVY